MGVGVGGGMLLCQNVCYDTDKAKHILVIWISLMTKSKTDQDLLDILGKHSGGRLNKHIIKGSPKGPHY